MSQELHLGFPRCVYRRPKASWAEPEEHLARVHASEQKQIQSLPVELTVCMERRYISKDHRLQESTIGMV